MDLGTKTRTAKGRTTLAAPDTLPPHPVAWRVLRSIALTTLRTICVVVPVFLFATFITFLLGALSGLNPAAAVAGEAATPTMVAQLNRQFGLDKPLWQQYLTWMGDLFHGNLGVSWFEHEPVSTLIFQRLGISVSVAGFALLIAIVFGTALGLLAALRQGGWVDRAVTVFSSVIGTIPPFALAIVLILVFSSWLRLVPAGGYVTPGQDFGKWLELITLPAVALSLQVAANIARLLRSGLVGALSEHYVTGAIMRGFSYRRVVFVHALRNAAGPALALLGMSVPILLGGAVVNEQIFAMPGFGLLATQAALEGDVPTVQGVLVVAIVLVVLFNVLVNVSLTRLQPAANANRAR